jgi:hypothetical protein
VRTQTPRATEASTFERDYPGTTQQHRDQRAHVINSLTLAALPTAAKLSRTQVSVTLRWWGLGHLVDEAQLVTSELVTNAVEATGIVTHNPAWGERQDLATIRLRLTHLETRIVIEVWDRDLTPPAVKDLSADAEDGRGLAIVGALSRQWGYFHPIEGGKVVWAELPIPPPPMTAAGLPARTPPTTSQRVPAVKPEHDPALLKRVRRGLREI